MSPYLLAAISPATLKMVIVVCVFVVCALVVDKLCNIKLYIDTIQYRAARAGGVAMEIGFKKFDELLFWAGAGNVKKIRECIHDLWQTYCQSDDGPRRLARDVFMATWGKLRNDPVYGPECRQEVVHEALGLDINDKMDVTIARAAERLNKIGWGKLGAAGLDMAGRDWKNMTAKLKALFDEVMEDSGEKKIAARVAKPTIEALMADPNFRAVAVSLIKTEYAKLTPEELATA